MTESQSSSGQLERTDWATILFLCVLAASLAGNVFQGLKLHSKYMGNDRSASVATEKQTGQSVPSLTVSTIDGKNQVLGLTGRRTVLYVFSPDCHWCARNLANIVSLSHKTSDRYRFVGIAKTADNLAPYVASANLDFPIYVDSNPADFKRLDFLGTPQTIVLSPDGTVEHNWPGAYTGPTEREVDTYFSVTLPGLLAR